MICAENQKLLIENPLLKEQIRSLEEINSLCMYADSLHQLELGIYREELISNDKEIQKLKSDKKNIIFGTSLGSIFLFILGLIL